MESLETRTERLVALLRSDPAVAAAAVRGCKIALLTQQTGKMDIIEQLGGGIVAQVFEIGPSRWRANVFRPLKPPQVPIEHSTREYVLVMLRGHLNADGWVLA